MSDRPSICLFVYLSICADVCGKNIPDRKREAIGFEFVRNTLEVPTGNLVLKLDQIDERLHPEFNIP